MGMVVLAALALAGCKDEGGELRDATARRRAELADSAREADGAADTAAADSSSRLPVFAGDTTPAAAAGTAKTDSAKAAAQTVATEWTTGVRAAEHAGVTATVRGLRAAANTGFDRLVLDFGDGPVPGWKAEYMNRPVTECGSGETVQLGTSAALKIRLDYTQAHDDAGHATLRQRDLPLNMTAMRRMVIVCDFEGVVEVAIGTSSAQPYRVTELQNPSRLAIDVQQKP
jgi:hypothetical protein